MRPSRPIRLTRVRRRAMATRTATASTQATNEISRRGPPAGGPFLFRGDRAQQPAGVVMMPDQSRQSVAVRLEGNGLLVDIKIDVVQGPASHLAPPQAGLQATAPP